MTDKDIIWITGHKNPDSDSICSAIAYADFKKKNGVNAMPARLGDISRETEFILNYFNVTTPPLLKTVRTQITDLNIDPAVPVTHDSTLLKAWARMKLNNVKTLPVVDEENHLHGLITVSDIANKYLDTIETNVLGKQNTNIQNIADTINAKILTGNNEDLTESGKVIIVAMQKEEMLPFLEKGDIVIVGNRTDTQLEAIKLQASCLIITGNAKVEQEVLEEAKANNVILMVCPQDTFTTSRLISQSIAVANVMTTEGLIRFNLDDFIDDIKTKMLQTRYRSYPVIDDNNVIQGFISRYHLISSRKKKVILVDHNEKGQTVDGIDEAEIMEIVDHHRFGDIQTAYPISVKLEPVGSTATIIANIFFDNAIRPSKSISGILCAAIISDTMNFKSPTSVYKDKLTADKLAEIAGINIEKFAEEMIKESSSIHGKSAKDIFHEDFKEFNLADQKFAISQIKTMDTDCIKDIYQEILDYMHQICESNSYNLVMLLITDIIKEGSEIIVIGESKTLIEKAFNLEIVDNKAFLPGVVSRKKQIIPVLSNII
ncbi:MAG: putative manganese-dependent inorganic diphosphatase [Candidatus Cloacimonetes bacterium]|nr:putative manganese-dependent inorganic diphosphatase [Candidatus Cloacimonadota bacterium]MDD4155604.1 putative manganese-dependent inorganic diphosphatase [Candidatus Cloacimonadota bacterium]